MRCEDRPLEEKKHVVGGRSLGAAPGSTKHNVVSRTLFPGMGCGQCSHADLWTGTVRQSTSQTTSCCSNCVNPSLTIRPVAWPGMSVTVATRWVSTASHSQAQTLPTACYYAPISTAASDMLWHPARAKVQPRPDLSLLPCDPHSISQMTVAAESETSPFENRLSSYLLFDTLRHQPPLQ